jgi:transposase
MQQLQHELMNYTMVGVDSHKHSHTLVFTDCFARELGTMVISSIPSEFDAFLKEATQKYLIQGTTFCFGMEDTTHYGRTLTHFLLEQKQVVKIVNANLVASETKANNNLKKSDYIDAFSCARILVSRFELLPMARVNDELFIFKSIVTRRKALKKSNHILRRQLQSIITENYPTYQDWFKEIVGQSSLAFLSHYPSPSLLKESSLEALTELLSAITTKTRGKKSADTIWKDVHQAGVRELPNQSYRNFNIQSMIRQYEYNQSELVMIEEKMASAFRHLDIPLMSMKGIDLHLACSLVNAIGDINRFKNAAALANYAGVSPALYASGSTHKEYANRRGNRELATLFFQLAVSVTQPRGGGGAQNKFYINPFFADLYLRKRSEGKTHLQALKVVQRRLVNIVFGIIKYKQDYINPPMLLIDKETGEIVREGLELNENQLTHIYKHHSTFE